MTANPYNPRGTPLLEAREPHNPVALVPAPVGRRIIAFLIDAAALACALWVAQAMIDSLHLAVVNRVHDPKSRTLVLMLVISAIVFGALVIPIAYFSLCEGSRFRASLGKRLLGIQVVDLQGRRLSGWRATLRAVAKLVTLLPAGLGAIWIFCNDRRQALHDLAARTMVVRARPLVDLHIPDNFNAADPVAEPWMLEAREPEAG